MIKQQEKRRIDGVNHVMKGYWAAKGIFVISCDCN